MGSWTAASAALLLAACHATAKPARVDAGPPRIVSLTPSTTEAVFAVGAGALLVGRSRYCDYPPEVTKLPEIGGFVDPSYEAILALSPSLVVGGRGPAGAALVDRLNQRHIATYFPETETFAQIDAMITGVGDKTGHPSEAQAFVHGLDARVAAIEAAANARPTVRVLLVFGFEPIGVAGPKSFAGEMLRRAGATNVVIEGGTYPTLGVERVLMLDPDVVINAAMAEPHADQKIGMEVAGWNRVRAVREGHVVALKDESLLRPGPRIDQGLRVLAKAIHPDL